MKKVQLNEIAEVYSGCPVKRKAAGKFEKAAERYQLITLKSFHENGHIDPEYVTDFRSAERVDSKFLVQSGMIIMRLTKPYTVVHIPTEWEDDNYLIPSQFAILNIRHPEVVLPGFVAYYLNSAPVKQYFSKLSTGSAISKLTLRQIKDIDVRVVELSKQKKFMELKNIVERYIETVRSIARENQQLLKALYRQLIEP